MRTILALLASCLVASGASVTLAWDPNPPADAVIGYKLYYGAASRTYVSSNIVTGTTGTITNLTGNVYYFAVTAFNATGESFFSAEVSWTNFPGAPSTLRIQSSTNTVTLFIEPGANTWLVQKSQDLILWQDLITGLAGFSAISLVVDPYDRMRFYRIVQL